jgi:transposase
MTHKLISTQHAADWLGISIKSVEDLVNSGRLSPDISGPPSYFDAKKVQILKERLQQRRRRSRIKWPLVGCALGFVAVIWLLGREKQTDFWTDPERYDTGPRM